MQAAVLPTMVCVIRDELFGVGRIETGILRLTFRN